MKKIAFIFVVILFSCSDNHLKNEIFDNRSLSQIHVGMHIDSVFQVVEKQKLKVETLEIDNTQYKLYYIYLNENRTMYIQIQPNCTPVCKVNQILTNSNKFKSEKGIGVGEKISAMKALYSPYYTLKDNEFIYIFTKELPNVAFLINRKKMNPKAENFSWNELPENEEIQSILIHL